MLATSGRASRRETLTRCKANHVIRTTEFPIQPGEDEETTLACMAVRWRTTITVRASTVVHRAVWVVDDACVNARPLSFRQKGHCSRWLRGANHASEIDVAYL